MSFEDDYVELFIAENTVVTMQEKLQKQHNSIYCHGVEEPCKNKGKWRRTNTAYCEEERNWVFLCDRCFEIEEEFWREQWAEYYSERL